MQKIAANFIQNHFVAPAIDLSDKAAVAADANAQPQRKNMAARAEDYPGAQAKRFFNLPNVLPIATRDSKASGNAGQSSMLRRNSSTGQQSADALAVARRGSFSGSTVAPAAAVAPYLHEILGEEATRKLDTKFGSAQPASATQSSKGMGLKKWELDQHGKPAVHERRVFIPDVEGNYPDLTSPAMKEYFDLDAMKSGEKSYMWAVSKLGRLIIGEEIPAEFDPKKNKRPKAGHPVLVAGGTARMAGELRFSEEKGLNIINKSGRYARFGDRPESGLKEVQEMLAKCGLVVGAEFISRHTPWPFVYPSLAEDPTSGVLKEPPVEAC